MYKKAEGKKLIPAWLTLSNKKQELKKRIYLTDLLFEVQENTLRKAHARKLWLTLVNNGFYLHPALEKQYSKQRVCFFDGGEITTKRADDGNYEESCTECGYIYSER